MSKIEILRKTTSKGAVLVVATTGALSPLSGVSILAVTGLDRRHRPDPRGVRHDPRSDPRARAGGREVRAREALRPRGSGVGHGG